ncbi:O-antigen ligase family protein [Paenibacillus cymbidii]|uniref:O-antigen ligase family protein n=1 Tax=Paenibacillus cymbidii TaxID=1639034 RepID=UPI0010802474|nr:O-antigen ligase family protein [Paenibacillus cymbidii]
MNPKNPNRTAKAAIAAPSDTDKSSLLFWLSMVFVVYFLVFVPYNKNGPALFNGNIAQYEGPIYSAVLWSGIFLVVAAIYFFFHWRLRDHRDLLSFAVWLLPLSYVISLTNAASHQFATNMVFIVSMYAIFYLIGSYMGKNNLGSTIFQLTLVISGYIIVLFGYLNLFGNTYFKDAVMLDQGLRITSVFQYANAYAAYLLAMLFCCLYLAVTTRKWYWIVANGLMLVPILNSLLLTQSRGGYVVLPILFVLILPFLSLARQIMMSIYLLIGVGLAVILSDKFTSIGEPIATDFSTQYNRTGEVSGLLSIFSGDSFDGWWRLILSAAVAAAVIWLMQRYVHPLLENRFAKWKSVKWLPIAYPLLIVVIGALGVILLFATDAVKNLLPDMLAKRVESINFNQHSVLERGTLYKDATKIIGDYPVFGTGGGGWSALWEKYQNNPYIVRQAHNFFLQYVVDVGFFGFVLLLGFLGWIYYLFIRKATAKDAEDRDKGLIFFIVATCILVHSIIDFEMSYAYLGVIIFLSLGGMTAMSALRPLAEEKKLFDWERWRWIYPSLVSVIAVVLLVSVFIHFRADRFYKQTYTSLREQQPFQESLALLDKAIGLKPYHPDYLLLKANLMDQAYEQSKDDASKKAYMDESVKLVEKVAKKEPYNRGVFEERYSHAMTLQQPTQALDVMLDGIRLFPWDTQVVDAPNPADNRSSFYERALDLMGQLGVAAANSNDAATKKKYFDQAQALFAAVAKKQQFLTTLPEGQLAGRDFKVTTSMRLSMGQMAFADKNYAGAAEVLKPAIADTQNLKFQNTTDRSAVRYYLAALKKTGQADQALYDKLIAADPKEKEEYDKLTK